MSDAEERSSLLANVDENPELDDEQLAAMQVQQMMGFSSFGGPEKPKRQPRGPKEGKGFGTGANMQPVRPRNPSTSTTGFTTFSPTSHPFVPASLPPRAQKQTSKTPPPFSADPSSHNSNVDPSNATTSLPTLNPNSQSFIPETIDPPPTQSNTSATHSNTHRDSSLDEKAYTNPHTGYSLTKRELLAYERGVIEQITNNDGAVGQVKVYFKPNFVDDNPWEELEVARGLRAGKKEVGAATMIDR